MARERHETMADSVRDVPSQRWPWIDEMVLMATRTGKRFTTGGHRVKRVLVIDIGGTTVKVAATGHRVPRRFPSGPTMTPPQMVAAVKRLTADWKYDVISIGYPGVVKHNRVMMKPKNLGRGWVAFDFPKAFGCPVKLINDAAMQALGSYRGGLMLFLGLGTGLGSALIANGEVVPLELAHLSYRHGTYEDYVGIRGLKRLGKTKWSQCVADVARRFKEALQPDDVVLGGGGAKQLRKLPTGCRRGDNAHAFRGGFRLWNDPGRFKGGRHEKQGH